MGVDPGSSDMRCQSIRTRKAEFQAGVNWPGGHNDRRDIPIVEIQLRRGCQVEDKKRGIVKVVYYPCNASFFVLCELLEIFE